MTSAVIYQRKRALIIGINKYRSDPLQYCINDANDLQKNLQRIDFDISSGVDCDLRKFYQIVDTFADSIQRDDLVLFYFAGHGKQMEDENYLLPSDYDYDHRDLERNYIPSHAINVKYIMKKIDDRKCRITIYLFDCCRQLVKTRAPNSNQGLLPMNAPLQSLIVYACAPGKAVQDETRNNRNGSFIENLLKYIATPNKDVEEMMKNVAYDVNLQTGGFQLPYRTSSLTEKVYLVKINDQEHNPTAWLETIISQPTHSNRSSTDINILLLGETDVGKTTFINAFANYLVHDTLDAALKGDIQLITPFQWSHTDPETFEISEIMVGTSDKNECCQDPSITGTQTCRSYNFTIGNRLLRFIDTPPIGDTRGLLQDVKNMEHIFTYISQYKHLNSVCILMKSGKLPRYADFAYCIKELLTHLHINIKQNIIWVFTHTRSTFYRHDGNILPMLKRLFRDISSADFQITRENSFLFDNETLRILALNKDHSEYVHRYLTDFKKSWDISIEAFHDLVSFILSCKPYLICETFILNIVRQLTYKLIGLISDKISSRLSVTIGNTDSSHWNLENVFLRFVCARLTQFIKMNAILAFNNGIYRYFTSIQRWDNSRVDYEYLQTCTQYSIAVFPDYVITELNTLFCEKLYDKMKSSSTISEFLKNNSISPFEEYILGYILHSFNTKLNEQMSNSHFLQHVRENVDSASDKQLTKYIYSVFYEEFIKQTANVEYSKFLQKNSMTALHNDTIKQICQLLFEYTTWNSYNFDFKNLFLINLAEQTIPIDVSKTDQLTQIKDILKLLNELCTSPVNGVYVRQFIEDLEKVQQSINRQTEHAVNLPKKAQSSSLMRRLRAIIEQN